MVMMWSARLREVFPELDAFSEWRLRQFLEMCARFDESGSRDVDAFLLFAREHRVAAAGATRALQVMTIHKSKGLEFDVVILPDLQVTVLDDARRVRLLTARNEDGGTEWVLDRPPSRVLEWDGKLVPEVERLEARAAFEGLCRLYVAMTRAKQGLYVIQHSTGMIQGRSEAGLVRSLLKESDEGVPYELPTATPVRAIYERGTRDWFESHEMSEEDAAQETPQAAAPQKTLGELLRAVNQPVQRRTPSGEESFRLKGSDLLTPQRELSRRMGTLVHELFEVVKWIEEGDTGAGLHALWKARGLDQRLQFEEAAGRVCRALKDGTVRKYFTQGADTAQREVWSERRFDLLLEGEWISGTLDRVVLEQHAKGEFAQATIIDFKTDHVIDAASARKSAEGYAPQMKLYRQAVQRLTGLKMAQVKVALVFVAGPWVVEE